MGKVIKEESVVGLKFNRLTVLEVCGRNKHSKLMVKCKCECGNDMICVFSNLKYKTMSCGCYRAENNSKRKVPHSVKLKKQRENALNYYNKFYKNNETYKTHKKLYYEDNKQDINKKKYIRHKRKMLQNVTYKFKIKLRTRIQVAFKKNYIKGSWLKYLGCSVEEAKKYIEIKFTNGMSWDNYGMYGWHIDHIIPLSSIKSTNIEDYSHILHYTNLQPLWAKDNLSKGNKIL
jgi:hypothetical protein